VRYSSLTIDVEFDFMTDVILVVSKDLLLDQMTDTNELTSVVAENWIGRRLVDSINRLEGSRSDAMTC
jgi:hypothetical protein